MKLYLAALPLAALLTLTGCVTGQRTFAVPVPVAAAVPVTKGAVYIGAVTDNRVFENKPSDPSTPSVSGDVTMLSAEGKDRMIGRQRNGFGKAMGDIALSDNDTVTKRVRALLEEGLRRAGYSISADASAPTTLTATVDEFWAWMTPGFFALTFETKISTTVKLTANGNTTTFVVKSHGLNHGQVAKDGNWQEAFEPAFTDYLDHLDTELAKDTRK